MKKLPIIISAALILIPLGYISYLLTRSACEQKIARWTCLDAPMNQEVFVLSDAYPSSLPILQKAGAKVKAYQPKPDDYHDFDGFSWVAADKAVVVFPYVVKIRRDYNEGGLSGEGGETIFLCLFGIPIQLWYNTFWTS